MQMMSNNITAKNAKIYAEGAKGFSQRSLRLL